MSVTDLGCAVSRTVGMRQNARRQWQLGRTLCANRGPRKPTMNLRAGVVAVFTSLTIAGLSACGGGGGSDDGQSRPTTNTYTAGVYQPESSFPAKGAAAPAGTDPFTPKGYPAPAGVGTEGYKWALRVA